MFGLQPLFILFTIWGGVLICIPKRKDRLLKDIAFWGSVGIFLYTISFWCTFNFQIPYFQQIVIYTFYDYYTIIFGFDFFSLSLITLTTFTVPLCILMSWVSVRRNLKSYLLLFILLEFLLVLAFICLDFFLFYLFFEFSLIPMFLLIGSWGSQGRKSKAAYYLFLYTLFGSLFMLLALIYLLNTIGTTNYFVLLTTIIPKNLQIILWPAIFIAFAIKIPMFPFHIWLPEAHVEAPTAGSVLLAGIVLKLGGYGMARFLLPLFPYATELYTPFVIILALMGTVYAAIAALRQVDMKRIIAYSSIAHMNFGLLGLFSNQVEGYIGFMYLLLGHGLISSALFFIVGVLYDRYHSRLYSYYTGLTVRMPLFSFFFFFFTIGNVAFPGTFNFAAEILILCSLPQISIILLLVSGLSLFISTIYSFWLFTRIAFGTPNTTSISQYFDLTRIEFLIFLILAIPVLLGGLFPNSLLQKLLVFFFFI